MDRSSPTTTHAPAQTRAYLRLLYSARFGRGLERAVRRARPLAPELEFVRRIDFAHLATEQKARIRNLAHAVRGTCRLLSQCLDETQFRALVAAYADSPTFWHGHGRSLTENFCLYAYKAYRSAGDEWSAEVARLEGVTCGLPVHAASSPWAARLGLDHSLSSIAPRRIETWTCQVCPIDAAGTLISASAASGAATLRASFDGSRIDVEIAR